MAPRADRRERPWESDQDHAKGAQGSAKVDDLELTVDDMGKFRRGQPLTNSCDHRETFTNLLRHRQSTLLEL
jgi:hypothetical protein